MEDLDLMNFGVAFGKSAIGYARTNNILGGYAIKGFWRGNEGTLNGIKKALIGKG